MNDSRTIRTALLILGVLGLAIVTIAVYMPGLSGGFILDDFPNLSLLSQLPDNYTLTQLLNLSMNGIASDFGRPISMLSFLLQAGSWPNDPFSFKIVNLGIHIMNGALLVLICQQIAQARPELRISPTLLFAAVALWLLHPIHVSNVLYVVQRMNLLASLFTLAGLLVYLWSRNQYTKSQKARYLSVMIGAPIFFAVVGLLSKENGVLLYLYLLALELTLLAGPGVSEKLFKAKLWAVYVPIGIGMVGLILYLPGALSDYAQKPFSPDERIFTQFPVLASYLGTLVSPAPNRLGLFHDSFPLFDSAFSMPVVLAAGAILLLLFSAIHFRLRYPVFAFGILWYFFGHAMESTIFPLELYFEHRNYLPSVGIVLSLVFLVHSIQLTLSRTRRYASYVFGAAVLAGFSLITVMESSIWGDSLEQAQVELQRRPTSYRAKIHLVQTLTNSGNPQAGYQLHKELIDDGSARLSDYIRWLEFSCLLQNIEQPANGQVSAIAASAAMDYSVIGQLNNLIPAAINGPCPSQLLPKLKLIMESLERNPQFQASWPDLLYARANIHYSEGGIDEAANLAQRSYSLRPDVGVGLTYLSWLIELTEYPEARRFLREYEAEFQFEIASRDGLANRLNQLSERL